MALTDRHWQSERVGDVLKQLKDVYFVGRAEECRVFHAALVGAPGQERLLNVSGPAGVGKSALLDAFRRAAEAAGAAYAYVDAERMPSTPQGLAAALSRALQTGPLDGERPVDSLAARLEAEAERRPVILAFDSYNPHRGYDTWFRESFLARLPRTTIVVVAGREALGGPWRESAAWRRLVRPLPLRPFDRAQTAEFLNLYDVCDERLVEAAWRATRGNPFALSLAAELAEREGPETLAQLEERHELVRGLTRLWFRELPDPALQHWAEAASLATWFDLDLLEHTTGSPVPVAVFDQLTKLSFVAHRPDGWSLDPLVRETLERDLRWRSQRRHDEMRMRVLEFFARRAVDARDSRAGVAALAETLRLSGNAMVDRLLRADTGSERLRVVEARPQDTDRVLDLWKRLSRSGSRSSPAASERQAAASDFPLPAVLLELQRQRRTFDLPGLFSREPSAFHLLLGPGGALLGFAAVLPVTGRSLRHLEEDPVTRPFVRRLAEAEHLGEGASLSHTWFVRHIDLVPEAGPEECAALLRDLLRLAAARGRVVTSTASPLLEAALRGLGFSEVPGARHEGFGVGTVVPTYQLDLRGGRLAALLERTLAAVRSRGSSRAATAGPQNAPDEAEGDSRMGDPWSRTAAVARETRGAATGTGGPASSDPAGPGSSRPPVSVSGGSEWLAVLTSREREVALAVAEGLSNAEIGQRLFVTTMTVKKHLTNIYGKLGVTSRAQLMRLLLRGPGSRPQKPGRPDAGRGDAGRPGGPGNPLPVSGRAEPGRAEAAATRMSAAASHGAAGKADPRSGTGPGRAR